MSCPVSGIHSTEQRRIVRSTCDTIYPLAIANSANKAFTGHTGPMSRFDMGAIDEDQVANERRMPCGKGQGDACSPSVSNEGHFAKPERRHPLYSILCHCCQIVATLRLIAQAV